MSQTFNPELFLNTQITDASSTELLNVDEGEYLAISDPVTAESFRDFNINKGERAGSKGYALDINWSINDETGVIKAKIGRPPRVRQSIMLDIQNDGSLEMGAGRNVGLGQLREALGQNLTGRPWSFSLLGGQVAKVKVKHRIDSATGRTYVEVASVTKA